MLIIIILVDGAQVLVKTQMNEGILILTGEIKY